MKRNIVLTAFIGMLSFVGVTAGQATSDTGATVMPVDHTIEVYFHVIRVRSSRKSSFARDTVVHNYTGLQSPNAQLFEADIRASTPDSCLAASDFSTAVPVGPERASLTFDPETNTNTVQWSIASRGTAVCRVLLVRTGDESSDYFIVRGYYETTDPATGTPQTIDFTTKKVIIRELP